MSERSADLLDLASQAEALATANALAKAMANSLPEQHRNSDGTTTTQGKDAAGKWRIPECVECDDVIPEPRLVLGKIRCVHCQVTFEKKHRKY